MAGRRHKLINANPSASITATWGSISGVLSDQTDLQAVLDTKYDSDSDISEAAVTQHQAALNISESQIIDGTVLARVSANETIDGNWTFDVEAISDLVINSTDSGSTGLGWTVLGATVGYIGANTTNILEVWNASVASRLTLDPDGNLTVDGDVSGATIGGISEANLLDKSANEIIPATWEFNNAKFNNVYGDSDTSGLTVWGGIGTGAQVELYGVNHASVPSEAFYDAVKHTFRDVDASPTFAVIDSVGLDVSGAITATSYGGISEANLLDKSANETVNGNWKFFHNLGGGADNVRIGRTSGQEFLFNVGDSIGEIKYVQDETDATSHYWYFNHATSSAGNRSIQFQDNDDTFFQLNISASLIQVLDGYGLRFYDSDNSDYLTMTHEGADFLVGNGTGDKFTFENYAISHWFGSRGSDTLHNIKWAAHDYIDASAQVGACVIQLGTIGFQSRMQHLKICGYEYGNPGSGGGYFEVDVAGYDYAGSGNWTNNNFNVLGNPPFDIVRLGEDPSGNPVVVLGDTTTSWAYPKVWIESWDLSFSSQTDDDATVTLNVTDLTGYSYDATFTVIGSYRGSNYLYHQVPSGHSVGWLEDTSLKMRFNTSDNELELLQGYKLGIYDGTNADNGVFYHDGTNFNTDFINTTNWNIDNLNAIVLSNGFLYMGANAGDGDRLIHFAMDRDWTFRQVGTGAATLLALRSEVDSKQFRIENSAGNPLASFFTSSTSGSHAFRIYDPAGTDSARFYHDGTHFYTDFANTADWYISGLTETHFNNRIRTDAEVTFGNSSYGLKSVTGTYGSVQTTTQGAGNYLGYSIDGELVFMKSESANSGGIYDDLNNEWKIRTDTNNAGVGLYYNGTETAETRAGGMSFDDSVYLNEITNANTDITGYGQVWTKNTSQQELWFTGEDGTSHHVAGGSLSEVFAVRATADEIVNNSSTLQDDNELSVQVRSGESYYVKLIAVYHSFSATPDLKIAWSSPSGSEGFFRYANQQLGGGSPTEEGQMSVSTTVGALDVSGSSAAPNMVDIEGYFIAGADGSLTFRWCQQAATMVNTVRREGSHLILIRATN